MVINQINLEDLVVRFFASVCVFLVLSGIATPVIGAFGATVTFFLLG
jgi:hypothetical protein